MSKQSVKVFSAAAAWSLPRAPLRQRLRAAWRALRGEPRTVKIEAFGGGGSAWPGSRSS